MCNPAIQREVIAACAASIAAAETAHPGVLIGAEPASPQPKAAHLTVAALMQMPASPEDVQGMVVGYMQAVAAEERNPLVLAWLAYSAMMLYPECLAAVAADTAGHKVWFEGGEGVLPAVERFQLHMAGSAVVLAKTGVQAVVSEWQLYGRLS